MSNTTDNHRESCIDLFKNSLAGTTWRQDTTCVSSVEQFNSIIDQCTPSTNTAIITDEKWKYPVDDTGVNYYESAVLAHSNMQNKDVIVVTHRYNSQKFGPRHWVVSYPVWFLSGRYYKRDYNQLTTPVYGFSSLNRRPAIHRLMLGSALNHQGLLDQLIFTMGNKDTDAWLPYTDRIPEFDKFKQLLPISLIDDNISDFSNAHIAYTNAYCNIVTETETSVDVFNDQQVLPFDFEIITEKSSKPFLSGQVPLFLACRGHYAYLKSLGFEVMEDLVPAGYDMMGTQAKIATIVDIVSKGKEFIQDFYYNHLSEIKHNYELVISGTVEQKLIKNIHQFIRG